MTASGSAYALYPPAKSAAEAVGEWNASRLLANGNRVEHGLNGEKQLEFESGGEDWLRRVAASRFKTQPRVGREPKGHMFLQDHGGRVEFRNLKLRPLA